MATARKNVRRYSPILAVGIVGLAVGVYLTVASVGQNSDDRSHAALVNGPYNGTLASSGNIINGSVTGDVIGNSNTISGNVDGCIIGNNNIVGGKVTGTVSGSGNIIAYGSGNGPCLSTRPTPTEIPLQTPTPMPATPTAVPTSMQSGPTPTAMPVTPTVLLTQTPTPSLSVSLTPAPTGSASGTQLVFRVALHGIGSGGDAANPNSGGNTAPQRLDRPVTVSMYNATNTLVLNQPTTVHFDATTGVFNGTLDLGSTFATGAYVVKIKEDQSLRGVVPGIQTVIAGQTTTLPKITLVVGDVDNNNQVNILDYNIILGCYSDFLPAKDCTGNNKMLSDLTDDGNVNQFDYNLFIRELTNVAGQ